MAADQQATLQPPFELKAPLENGMNVEEMDTAGPEPEKGVERGLQVRSTRAFWERTAREEIRQEPGGGRQPFWEGKSQQAVRAPESLQSSEGNSQQPQHMPRDDRTRALPAHGGAADAGQQPREVRMTQVPPGLCLELQVTDNGLLGRVKEELLDEETPSADVSRQHFRQVCYRETEGPRKACRSLQELCRQWLKPDSNTKEQILELVILEQFLTILPPEMQSWVKEFCPGTCSQAVALAEDFLRRQPGGQRQGEQVSEPYKKVVVHFPEAETAPTGTVLEIKQESDRDGSLLGDGTREERKRPEKSGRLEQQGMLQRRAKQNVFHSLEQGGASEVQPGSHPEKEKDKFINSQGRYEELEEEAVPPRILQDERLKTCPDCGKGFVWRSQVIEHQRTHTGERPYACSYCEKSFSSKSYVIKHERIHTGEKPYKCSDCGRSFSRRDVLVAHQRTHTGEKPYKCMHCGQSFSARERLLVHERMHTGEKPYKCSECERCFRDRSSFYAHKRTHKGEKPNMLHRMWEKV